MTTKTNKTKNSAQSTKTTSADKSGTTLASLARKLKIDPKNARAKFRRMKKERPFDHTKVTTLNAQQIKKATDFLKSDYREQE